MYFLDLLAFKPFWNEMSIGSIKEKGQYPLPCEKGCKKEENVF